jgi:hypothetical protein
MRHADPRMTANTYGHLAPDYLHRELEKFSFDVGPAELAASLLQAKTKRPIVVRTEGAKSEADSALTSARDTGFEPVAIGSGELKLDVHGVSTGASSSDSLERNVAD